MRRYRIVATDFSELLRTYRKDMGWKQAELAERWSYSLETISSWERRKRIPGNQEIPRVAKLLQMEAEKLREIIRRSREQLNVGANNENQTPSKTKAAWESSFETWGEVQSIYRTRTEFNKMFSYPRMFENAQSILAVGISLNAISQNYDRELVQKAILEDGCLVQLCYLDPQGSRCAEREDEEGYTGGVLASYTNTNIIVVNDLRNRIMRTDKEKAKQLDIRTYNMIPRFNIYIVNDTLMTVQGYAYGRGEETPTFVLERKIRGGLFDFYVSTAKHILKNSTPIDETITEHRGNV
jgi:transcriptional regulator with XRE-family HTH domain